MIFTESTIKISNNVSKMDSTIVLYRGDKNVEIRFTILQSPFKYSNTVATNVIESTNASYGQLVIKTPNDKPPIFSEVSSTKEGTVLFTITKEMIDEIEEVGVYTFQIRLMDENKQSRVTIPPVENGIEIKEPIAIEDDNTTNVVGLAKANYAVATLSDVDTPAFDDNGQYIKTNWNDGDIITNASLNKIEDGIYTTNENVTATKKYVDDKVTVKILPVDYNKNCATNVADLEPHSIYMSPNDAKFLYLGYEKLDGSFSGLFLSGNPHGKFIYTGTKDDTKIEVTLEGICYTAYFKTDTVDAHTEKTVFYLTKNNNKEFTPTTDYEPATKKYVDDNKIIYTVSSKVLTTIPANNIVIDNEITINNASINKNRRYYIEFLGSKKLCTLLVSEEIGNCIICNIGGYIIQAFNNSTNIMLLIELGKNDITTVTFTDLVIYEEEVKYLDNKYLETDLLLQNSISLGRIGDIGAGSSAIGMRAEASGQCSHAEGMYVTSSGNCSHAEGNLTKATGDGSHAEGGGTIASGNCSHAEGNLTRASSEYQHVQGKYNIEDTANKYAHIVGNGTDDNNRHNAYTLDWQGNAWFAGEVQGTNLPYTISSKVLATIPASNIKLDGEIAVNNISINKDRRYYIEFLGSKKLCSLLINGEIGNFIICSIGNYSIEIHNNTFNISIYIDKINTSDTTDTFTDLVIYEEEVKYLDNKYLETDLTLQNSISLGRIGDIGTGSSAIGYDVEASGYASHAEGSKTTASGDYSHAEGSTTTASGVNSHAEGDYTTASGASSHAEGYGSKASSQFQHVQGKYNIEDKDRKYAHIVGNGAGDAKRSNAHTLDWQGNAWYSGKVTTGAAPVEDMDLTTKKYVDDKVTSLPQLSFNEAGELVVTINGVSKTFVPKNV